jgi:hypothetical protein
MVFVYYSRGFEVINVGIWECGNNIWDDFNLW